MFLPVALLKEGHAVVISLSHTIHNHVSLFRTSIKLLRLTDPQLGQRYTIISSAFSGFFIESPSHDLLYLGSVKECGGKTRTACSRRYRAGKEPGSQERRPPAGGPRLTATLNTISIRGLSYLNECPIFSLNLFAAHSYP